jgi:hypothetical protein
MADNDNTASDSVEEHYQRSKVGRVIAEWELNGMGSELERYWTTDGQESMSLRELADLFNRRVLRAAMESAGKRVLDGEAENMYELLTSNETSAGSRVQAERRLEREGVDIQSLTSDFVSHQAIHTYLTKYRGASAPKSGASGDIEAHQDTIQRLRSRLIAVVTNSLSTLRSKGKITLGEFDIFLSIQIRCNDCGTQLNVSELFDNEGCECKTLQA